MEVGLDRLQPSTLPVHPTLGLLSRTIRHAVRSFVKSPGSTFAAVATLALGIGANTAIFSLIKTVMLQPLPYHAPHELVMVWNAAERGSTTWLSVQEIVSYRDEARSLAQLGAYTETNANLTGGDEPERVRAAAVTANLFETLGSVPLQGRAFLPGDGEPGAPDVVVLGHGLWKGRFGAVPDVVGQTIQVNGRPRLVVGVMPPSFRLPLDYRSDRQTELWIPLVIDRANLGQWGNRSLFGVGRLAAGTPPATASSELKLISDRWIRAGFVMDTGDGALERSTIPLQELITGDVRRPLLILCGAVAVVLLIACANVANLLLARADLRRREVAVRVALGAGRRDIVRQLLIESVLLSAMGGIAGLALARTAIHVLITLRPAGLPRVEEAALDLAALTFTAGLSVVAGIVFGLVPALQLSRQGPAAILNESGRGGGRGRARLAVRRGLVIAQLAFSVVLVIAAGLLVRSLIALNRIDLGFSPRHVLTAQLQLPAADYPEANDVVAFYRQLTDRLASVPGIAAAGAVRVLPLARTIGDWSITIEGRPHVRGENPNADYQAVTPGYFGVMGTTLVRGRLFSSADREDAPSVVVINDTMAARYWPGQDPLGRRFQMGGPGTTLSPLTIVGIVRTTRHNAVTEEPRAEMYLAHAQTPAAAGGAVRGMALVVKTTADPLTLGGPLRETIRALDRNLPIADVQSMEQITADALSAPRFAALLLGLFAMLALVLAAVGTYATISLLVTERSHEIGIRMALGAERRTILSGILGEGLALAAAGIVLGVAAALTLMRVLDTLLYEVRTSDPVTFAVVPVILVGVAVLASLMPARRAASLGPVAALRQG